MIRAKLWRAKVRNEKVKVDDPISGRKVEVVRPVISNKKVELIREGGFMERTVAKQLEHGEGVDAYIIDTANARGFSTWFEIVEEPKEEPKKRGRKKKEEETKTED